MNRRGALRTLVFASVCGGACGVGPGRWFVSGVQAGETAVFRMSFDDFSQLKNSYGSVRLNVPGIPSSSSQIVVTRMPGNQFYAVSAKCTHKGVAVNPFKKGVGLRCAAHGSQFEANGKVVNGPARSSLKSYKATYNGSDAVSVEFPNLGYSVATEFVEAGAGGSGKAGVQDALRDGLLGAGSQRGERRRIGEGQVLPHAGRFAQQAQVWRATGKR